MLLQAEQEAIARGCRGAWLDTYSFQARGFYERLGYAVFGILDHDGDGSTDDLVSSLRKNSRREIDACTTARGTACDPIDHHGSLDVDPVSH